MGNIFPAPDYGRAVMVKDMSRQNQMRALALFILASPSHQMSLRNATEGRAAEQIENGINAHTDTNDKVLVVRTGPRR